jgi:hypothetical protein
MRYNSSPAAMFGLGFLAPFPPVLPDPAPPVVEFPFSYWELKHYRVQSCHYVVRSTYDMVQRMIEDRIQERCERDQLEWLEWVGRNL